MTRDNERINKKEFNEQKIKFLNIQLIATIGFIIALSISYFLTLDKKLSLENKERLFSEETAQNLALFQTISKKVHDSDEQDLLLQIETSIFAIISAIIGLYIIFKNYRNKNLAVAETELF